MTTSSPNGTTSNGWLDTLLNTGLGVAKLFAGDDDKAKPAAAPAAKASLPGWVIPAAIGSGILLLVLVFFGLRSK